MCFFGKEDSHYKYMMQSSKMSQEIVDLKFVVFYIVVLGISMSHLVISQIGSKQNICFCLVVSQNRYPQVPINFA